GNQEKDQGRGVLWIYLYGTYGIMENAVAVCKRVSQQTPMLCRDTELKINNRTGLIFLGEHLTGKHIH
ncbi:hypothetical protein, partial [Brucella melitensis]|uniref:hypothetical protein n=1 Tax=Brucella melitensis TaxID=29459 RepID=UPI003B685114